MLIQHEIVKYYQPEDGATTYYEADWTSAYALARSGRLIADVSQRYGNIAGSIVSHIITNGHTRVSDLVESTEIGADVQSGQSNKPLHVNGLANGKRKLAEVSSVSSEDSTHQAIYDLLKTGYLTVLHESHLRPQADNVNEAISECKRRSQLGSVLKKAQQAELDRAVRALLLAWKTNEAGIRTQDPVNSLKRRFDDAIMNDYIHDKKRKVNGGYAAHDAVHLNVCSRPPRLPCCY